MTSQFQDGGHDVISGRKVLPPDECTCSVCPVAMQQRPPVPIFAKRLGLNSNRQAVLFSVQT